VLRIELTGIEPLIWRRVYVPGSWSLARLHDYLQWVMGWNDTHAHEFEVGSGLIAPAWWIEEVGEDRGADAFRDERAVRVQTVAAELGVGGEFSYRYDMGDDWRHRLVIEAQPETVIDELPVPRCVAGENACPPDNIGGPPGYQQMLAILRQPTHEEHADMLRWVGGVFDPAGFDLNRINRAWRATKRRRSA
jgi:hypothetical protein